MQGTYVPRSPVRLRGAQKLLAVGQRGLAVAFAEGDAEAGGVGEAAGDRDFADREIGAGQEFLTFF